MWQESWAKLTNQRVNYMHLPLAGLVSMSDIFCLLRTSSIVILVFYLFSTEHVRELWVWIQFTGLTLPLRVTPMNNPVTLISPIQSLGYIFVAANIICVALQIFEQFSPKARKPIHWIPSSNQILTQNDHPTLFNVIRFGVNEEPLRGYIGL